MGFWGTNLEELTDEQLIRRYQEKLDKDCVGVLCQRYAHLIYGLALSYFKNEEDSKDATMDIIERLFTLLLQNDIERFKPWLFTVSKNHCLGILRRNSRALNKREGYMRIVVDNMENGELLHHDPEELELNFQLLEYAMGDLKPEQRLCLELFYLEEKSYKEISELTGYDLKKVKSYIQNGKRNLRNYVVKYNDKTA